MNETEATMQYLNKLRQIYRAEGLREMFRHELMSTSNSLAIRLDGFFDSPNLTQQERELLGLEQKMQELRSREYGRAYENLVIAAWNTDDPILQQIHRASAERYSNPPGIVMPEQIRRKLADYAARQRERRESRHNAILGYI